MRQAVPSVSLYFNPRSDERSDISRTTDKDSSIIISIHAPTNGATLETFSNNYTVKISIHAPTNGATETLTCYMLINNISIHAPTNGATSR